MLDPRTHQPTNPFQLYDGTRHRTHSYYNTWESTNSGFWPSKTEAQSSNKEEEEEVDESGMCSPPLWTTSPPTSPSRHGRNNNNNNNHYRSLSPASRTQAIVRGQRELMEMVGNMPESNYELSLKDLVEHHRVQQQNTVVVEERRNIKGGGGSGRKVVKRSGTIDRGSGGFYLKMVFPSFSFGSKNKKNKKKKNNNNNKNKKKNESSSANGCSKVSPRPSASDGSVKGGVDKEWWKKSPLGSRESDSGASSINSGSTKSSGSSSSNSSSSTSNSRHRHEKSGGRCWPCIPRPKRQTQK